MPPAATKPAAYAVAALASAALALPADARAAPAPVVERGNALTAPTGLVRTPDGSLWVADGIRGICRAVAPDGAVLSVDDATSDWCGATELDHLGPNAPTGLAFDAATNTIFASDGASSGGAVWRWTWDPSSGLSDGRTIAELPFDRVDALAFAPGAATGDADQVYFTTKAKAVMRVPAAGGTARTIGQATHGASGIAVLGDRVYLAEGASVTSLTPGSSAPPATVVAGLETTPAAALAVDEAHGRLYVGTATPDGSDRVEVLDVARGAVETYETGFAGVSGMLVDAGDTPSLLVADDPGEVAGNIDTADQGRVWSVGWHELDRARITWSAWPAAITNATAIGVRYASTKTGAGLECRLEGPVGGYAWTPCDGSTTLRPADEGTYHFSVRTADAADPAPLESTRTFTVDRTAPKVWIQSPARIFVDGEAPPSLDFVADERFVSYSCSIDGAAAADCAPGEALGGLAVGDHTLTVTATDIAGNTSPRATRSFAVAAAPPKPQPPAPAPVPPPVPAPSTPASGTRPVAPPAAAPAGAAPATAAAARPAQAKPILFPFRLLPGTIARPRLNRAAGLRVRFDAPATAVAVRLRLTDAHRRFVLGRRIAVRPKTRTTLRIALSRAERGRLRTGLYLLSAVLVNAHGVAGNTQTHFLRVRATS